MYNPRYRGVDDSTSVKRSKSMILLLSLIHIPKEAVLMHNGTIDVANVSDIGSVFTIRLPYKITIGGQNEK